MREFGIDADRDDLRLQVGELPGAVAISEDLGGADEGEVERLEEDHPIGPFEIVRKLEIIDDFAVRQDRRRLKVWALLAYEYAHGCFLSLIRFGKRMRSRYLERF